MKKLILATCLLLSFSLAYSQVSMESFKLKEGKVTVEEVVSIPNASGSQLFENAKTFLSSESPSLKFTIESEDVGNYQIVGRGKVVTTPNQEEGRDAFEFKMSINIQYGEYRVTLTDMSMSANETNSSKFTAEESYKLFHEKGDRKELDRCLKDITPLLKALNEQMVLRDEDY